MKKFEKFVCLFSPLFFGLIFGFIGMYATKNKPELPQGIIMMCTGLICICFYIISFLLVKLIEKEK
jgi:hypothetical protein